MQNQGRRSLELITPTWCNEVSSRVRDKKQTNIKDNTRLSAPIALK